MLIQKISAWRRSNNKKVTASVFGHLISRPFALTHSSNETHYPGALVLAVWAASFINVRPYAQAG
jgi:hypothetical protein